MNYDNTCVNSMPINDCCESGTSRTMIDNLKETTDLLHMIEDKLDSNGSNPEKDIEIKDDVAKRILKKLDSMVARIGC